MRYLQTTAKHYRQAREMASWFQTPMMNYKYIVITKHYNVPCADMGHSRDIGMDDRWKSL
jgi:hypothetical protein